MAARRRRSLFESPTLPGESSQIVHLWLLRMLIPLGGHQRFVRTCDFYDDDVAVQLGLGHWVGPDSDGFDPRAVRAELRTLHTSAERKWRDARVPALLTANIKRLAELAGLTDVDQRILEFGVMLKTEKYLDRTADWLGLMSSVKVFRALSTILKQPEHEIRKALSPAGILARSALVSIHGSGTSTLGEKLDLLSETFADQIASMDADPISLLRETVTPSSLPQLRLTNFEHISRSLAILRPYLQRSITTKRKGVNVFLYGAPGTGKSELAKALAQDLRCELFEVASEDEGGDPVPGERRLRAFRAAQCFLAQRCAMILFDEVEDVFDDGDALFGRKSTAQTRKAWINRSLEENPVPTLWLSNSIGELDPAFIRRFDMVVELQVPPKKQREGIIREACADLCDEQMVTRVAEVECLAPAVVTRAATVVRSIREDIGESASKDALELLIASTLEAQGHRAMRRDDPNQLPDIYDPAFIHADADLTKVAGGLVQTKSGRLCLYGPPGTGKTAYGRWLSEQMGVPLHVKRASDLMSMWVGENEKNIARAFRLAEQDQAVLLMDEVDSFLQDRRGAQRSWEVSLVNEMLTQMEAFPGIFIASTNLMTGLDQAALRRFDLKVRFDFLLPDQAEELLRCHCVKLNLPMPTAEDMATLRRNQRLTPGDFAAVIRQHRFRPLASTDQLVSALTAECSVKEGAKSAMGFL